MLMLAEIPVHRSVADIQAYADRLHKADPDMKEEIPITPEEALLLKDHVRKQNKNDFISNTFDMNILGHKIKIL